MSNQPARAPRPTLDLRGAVDLGALAARRPAPGSATGTPAGGRLTSGGAPGGSGAAGPAGQGGPGDQGGLGGRASGNGAGAALASLVIEATDANFVAEVVERSDSVPVIVDFWATWCGPCKQLSPILENLAEEFGGRFLLATVDVDANQQLAAAFQVQSIPTVYAVLKGQPIPLFQGAQPEAQVRQVITELLRVAAANGVTGTVAVADGEADGEDVEPPDEPLPPLHQAAYDAIEAGDLPAAVVAYEQALQQSPADDLARVGLAQVKLLQRTQDLDPAAARAAAAAAPTDVEAQIVVADLDLLGGHVDDAFGRLIDTVRATSGAERDAARLHLVELFELVGAQDPRVPAARLALANALF